jgi:hypothetical protein
MKKSIAIITIIIIAAINSAFCEQIFLNNNFADSLSASQSKKLYSLTKNIFLDCSHKEPLGSDQHVKTCDAAKRIYNFTAYLIKKETADKEIIEEIKLRNSAFFDTTVYNIALSSIIVSGDANSLVKITAFIGTNCPNCKQISVPLYELSNGALKGKISVSMKPLYRQLGDIALIAANEQNKSWQLLRAYANTNDAITADNINDFFDEAKIDKNRIYMEMSDTNKIFSILNGNYSESKKCKMIFTPHLIFNGTIYESDMNLRWIIDFIDWKLTKSK